MTQEFPRYYDIKRTDEPIQRISGDLNDAVNARRTYNPKQEPLGTVIPKTAEEIPDSFPTEWLEIN